MVKLIIITGPESSGSAFISKVVANYLGATKNIDDWTGKGFCNSINKNIEILHRSQPSNKADEYFNLENFQKLKKKYENCEIYFIITTRYHLISGLSKKKRFNRTNNEISDNLIESKKILGKIIKSKEKFFIWNYETMIYLKEHYFDLLFKFLKHNNEFFSYPKVKDGNFKYIKES